MAAPAAVRASPQTILGDSASRYAITWTLLATIFFVSVLGLLCLMGRQTTTRLWSLWTGNSLLSIGILVPFATVALTLRAWRRCQSERCGSWWGLIVSAVSLLLAALYKSQALPFLTYHEATLRLVPLGLLVFLYVSGVVVLFAGFAFYRAALFPISLLLFLNPAPGFLTTMIDLPLQYAGAHTARAFAHWIGVPMTVDQLRIMFSPALGMFIAPGCNGMRGALTMGFLAATVGHLYALPWLLRCVYVGSGVIAAYLLNLVRLCGLVLFYRVALDSAWLTRHMTAVDYVLGSTLFFFAGLFILGLPRRWKQSSK
jgi:exosortase J